MEIARKSYIMAEGESLRFPALQKSVNQFIEEQRNKETLSKTRRDVGLLSEFLKSKQENRKIEEIQPQELNDFLSEFIVTVKRADGGDYEPSSLRGFIANFNQSSLEKREVFKEHRRRSRV